MQSDQRLLYELGGMKKNNKHNKLPNLSHLVGWLGGLRREDMDRNNYGREQVQWKIQELKQKGCDTPGYKVPVPGWTIKE